MAVGGVLRAALKAGNWARAAAESRRQARLLRNFSANFGERFEDYGGDLNRYYQRRGFGPERGMPANVGGGRLPFSEDEIYGIPSGMPATMADGRTVYVDVVTGRRTVPAPEMYSPIVSPYEGGRAWPTFEFDAGRADAPPPWVGRGPAPRSYSKIVGDGDMMFEPPEPFYFADSARGWGGYGSPLYGDNVPRAFWGPTSPPPPPRGAREIMPGIFRDDETGYFYNPNGYSPGF